jgi:hypothetical protein
MPRDQLAQPSFPMFLGLQLYSMYEYCTAYSTAVYSGLDLVPYSCIMTVWMCTGTTVQLYNRS